MADVLKINGVTINLADWNAQLDALVPHIQGGCPSLSFSRLMGALTALPDPWSGQPVTLSLDGGTTLHFAGDVVGYSEAFVSPTGWVREYRALGLYNRAQFIPITDAVSLTDTVAYNLPSDDPAYIASRAGRTCGQIVSAILTMVGNATALNAAGIGGYTSMGPPPVLPAATIADLAALTVIPPWRVTVSGERILQSLESFVQSCHPNHHLHVQPDGVIRFLDSRTYPNTTISLDSDCRLDMPSLTRDYSDCYSQVHVRGNTKVEGLQFQTAPWPGSALPDGGLQEDFAWGALSSSAAKAAWTPACWQQPGFYGTANETGSCTMSSTTLVTCAVTGTYPANYWDQTSTGALGWIILFADSLAGLVTQHVQARVVSSTASSGGHITVTLDTPMPATVFNSYQLWGLTAGCAVVGRKYKLTNAAMGAALQQQFPYPVPFINSTGMSVEMASSPVAEILYAGRSATNWLQIDPVGGKIYFSRPVQTIFGMPQWPDNIRVLLPVAKGTLDAWAPSSSTYAGTLHSVEGISRTKVITCMDWKDYSNQTNMDTFASEYLDSVKDVVVEGTAAYHGLLAAHLSPGSAVSIAAGGYTTGWETLTLPVVSAEIRWNGGSAGTFYDTMLHLSNRRGRYSAEMFLRPNITGLQWGLAEGAATFGVTVSESVAASARYQEEAKQLRSAELAKRPELKGAQPTTGAIPAMAAAQQAAAATMGQQAGFAGAIMGQQAQMVGAVMGQQAGLVGGIMGQQAQFQTIAADTSGVQAMAASMRQRGGLAGPEGTQAQAQAALGMPSVSVRRPMEQGGVSTTAAERAEAATQHGESDKLRRAGGAIQKSTTEREEREDIGRSEAEAGVRSRTGREAGETTAKDKAEYRKRANIEEEARKQREPSE